MKAHRFKTKLTTKEEVEDEFYSEVRRRVDILRLNKTKGQGIIAYGYFSETEEGVKAIAALKLDIMKEWENKGRSLKFLDNNPEYNFQSLLHKKHFGKS